MPLREADGEQAGDGFRSNMREMPAAKVQRRSSSLMTGSSLLTKHGIELVTLSAFYERMSSAGSALDSPRNKADHDHVSEAVPWRCHCVCSEKAIAQF